MLQMLAAQCDCAGSTGHVVGQGCLNARAPEACHSLWLRLEHRARNESIRAAWMPAIQKLAARRRRHDWLVIRCKKLNFSYSDIIHTYMYIPSFHSIKSLSFCLLEREIVIFRHVRTTDLSTEISSGVRTRHGARTYTYKSYWTRIVGNYPPDFATR